MCYDIEAQLLQQLKYYNSQFGEEAKRIAKDILEELKRYNPNNPHYTFHVVSGFSHPKLVVMAKGDQLTIARWGLMPHWAKDESQALKLSNSTLNARSETMFEKPSFRDSAKHKRCIIPVNGFYEHHHQGKKSYPYYVYPKTEDQFILAGLLSEWVNKETGEIINSFSILTTKANPLMQLIHNNPKVPESRMPVILQNDEIDEWLSIEVDSEEEKKELLKLCNPLNVDRMSCYNIRKIRGKEAIGNVPEVKEKQDNPELAFLNAEIDEILS